MSMMEYACWAMKKSPVQMLLNAGKTLHPEAEACEKKMLDARKKMVDLEKLANKWKGQEPAEGSRQAQAMQKDMQMIDDGMVCFATSLSLSLSPAIMLTFSRAQKQANIAIKRELDKLRRMEDKTGPQRAGLAWWANRKKEFMKNFKPKGGLKAKWGSK